jgi:hypothetical protein
VLATVYIFELITKKTIENFSQNGAKFGVSIVKNRQLLGGFVA